MERFAFIGGWTYARVNEGRLSHMLLEVRVLEGFTHAQY